MKGPPVNSAPYRRTALFWTSQLLSGLPGIAHGVTERRGGVSHPPFDSLNLGLHVGDDAASVWENRARAAWTLGFTPGQMVCAAQVHGARAAVVEAADAGRGAREHADAVPEADALLTDSPRVVLALFYADCLPVLFADRVHPAIAVAHAGWRGVAGGVIENTVAAMREAFGSRPEDLVAAVGPGIGPCCFEVGAEVAERFGPDAASGPAGRPHVDLFTAARRRLVGAGIPEAQVEVAGLCTSCLPERFFSHRRDNGRTGRLGALIGLKPGI